VSELDFRCISWMLQVSLDKTINSLTLKFLGSILVLPGSGSGVVVDCFNMFTSCFIADDRHNLSITRDSELLAGISAMCFIRAFSSLLIVQPTSTVIGDVRKQYRKIFQHLDDVRHLPCPIIMNAIRHLFTQRRERLFIDWKPYNPSFDELVPFAHALAQFAQFEYRGREHYNRKVPRWLVRFALRFLSQDPPPPTSVVVDCLTIIATELGCDVSDANRVVSDEKYVHTPKTTVSPLTLHQHTA
jgi:hypothetical protein